MSSETAAADHAGILESSAQTETTVRCMEIDDGDHPSMKDVGAAAVDERDMKVFGTPVWRILVSEYDDAGGLTQVSAWEHEGPLSEASQWCSRTSGSTAGPHSVELFACTPREVDGHRSHGPPDLLCLLVRTWPAPEDRPGVFDGDA